jgi:cell filamentation protein
VPHPWDTGDLERNWRGYFIPGTSVLRNRVGARTPKALRDAENDLVESAPRSKGDSGHVQLGRLMMF